MGHIQFVGRLFENTYRVNRHTHDFWEVVIYTKGSGYVDIADSHLEFKEEDVFVIGGETVYRQLLPYCKKAYITKIDHAYHADTHFPNLDKDPEWEMTGISDEQTYFDLEYVFTLYERVK